MQQKEWCWHPAASLKAWRYGKCTPTSDGCVHFHQPTGVTGEALMAASMIGASATQMDWIQLAHWTSPDEQGFGYISQFVE
ncbi:MAG: hypothetical protein ACR5LD_07370 [Symbiopectobacterium sp.]